MKEISDRVNTDELAGSKRYAFFGFLNPSVNLEQIHSAVDKEFVISVHNGVNQNVAQRVAYCQEGVNLTNDLLNEFYGGTEFPSRAAILGMLGEKAIGHFRAAEYCLVFQEYASLLILLRAAFDASAMLRFLSQNQRSMMTWVKLTKTPWKYFGSEDFNKAQLLEVKARKFHLKALGIEKETSLFLQSLYDSMVHPNIYGLTATGHFSEKIGPSISREAEGELFQAVKYLLKGHEGLKKLPLDSDPLIQRLQLWKYYAQFVLSHVLQFNKTVRDVNSVSKNAELLQQCASWWSRATKLLV